MNLVMDRICGAMLSRFKGPHNELTVPGRTKKELAKRLLVRDYEGSELANLLSDRYTAGAGLRLADWDFAVKELVALNPRKRMRMSPGQESVRKSLFERLELLLMSHKAQRRADDLLIISEKDSNYESFVTELCLSLGWKYRLERVGNRTRDGQLTWNLLRPNSSPMDHAFQQKLAIFHMGSTNDRVAENKASDSKGKQSPYSFTLVSEPLMGELIKDAYSKGLRPKTAFHSCSDFYAICEELELNNDAFDSDSSAQVVHSCNNIVIIHKAIEKFEICVSFQSECLFL